MFARFISFSKHAKFKFCVASPMKLKGASVTFFPSRKMVSLSEWSIKGILLDITGVLYESGYKEAIPGSIKAIERLRALKIPFRFVTNETQQTRESLVLKLKSFGYEVYEKEVFSPGVAVSDWFKDKTLRPYLLVHPDILPEFAACNQDSPNCVVVGDAAEHFTYENVNKAFKILVNAKDPVLIAMGKGKYYQEKGELTMDLGGFVAALEYATGVQAIVIGKPSEMFFMTALKDINVSPNEAVMIGDDISSDVGGSQECGMRGVLVETGKFRPNDRNHPTVKPDAIVKNLSEFINNL